MQTRCQRAPDSRLRWLLYRPLYGFEQSDQPFASWLEPPRPAVTLIVDLEGEITADGERLPDAWLGGLDKTYTVVGVGRRYAALDIELTPLGAYTVVGRPMTEIAGRCVPLGDLFGPHLADRLRDAPGWPERFDILEGSCSRAPRAARVRRRPSRRRSRVCTTPGGPCALMCSRRSSATAAASSSDGS